MRPPAWTALVEAFHDGRSGLVRIGCGPFVPDLLAQRLAGPLQRSRATMEAGVRLEIHSDYFESLCEGLYAYRYDFLVYDGRKGSGVARPGRRGRRCRWWSCLLRWRRRSLLAGGQGGGRPRGRRRRHRVHGGPASGDYPGWPRNIAVRSRPGSVSCCSPVVAPSFRWPPSALVWRCAGRAGR